MTTALREPTLADLLLAASDVDDAEQQDMSSLIPTLYSCYIAAYNGALNHYVRGAKQAALQDTLVLISEDLDALSDTSEIELEDPELLADLWREAESTARELESTRLLRLKNAHLLGQKSIAETTSTLQQLDQRNISTVMQREARKIAQRALRDFTQYSGLEGTERLEPSEDITSCGHFTAVDDLPIGSYGEIPSGPECPHYLVRSFTNGREIWTGTPLTPLHTLWQGSGAKVGKSMKPLASGQKWVTIEHQHVLIDHGGNILEGAPHLKGKNVGNLGSPVSNKVEPSPSPVDPKKTHWAKMQNGTHVLLGKDADGKVRTQAVKAAAGHETDAATLLGKSEGSMAKLGHHVAGHYPHGYVPSAVSGKSEPSENEPPKAEHKPVETKPATAEPKSAPDESKQEGTAEAPKGNHWVKLATGAHAFATTQPDGSLHLHTHVSPSGEVLKIHPVAFPIDKSKIVSHYGEGVVPGAIKDVAHLDHIKSLIGSLPSTSHPVVMPPGDDEDFAEDTSKSVAPAPKLKAQNISMGVGDNDAFGEPAPNDSDHWAQDVEGSHAYLSKDSSGQWKVKAIEYPDGTQTTFGKAQGIGDGKNLLDAQDDGDMSSIVAHYPKDSMPANGVGVSLHEFAHHSSEPQGVATYPEAGTTVEGLSPQPPLDLSSIGADTQSEAAPAENASKDNEAASESKPARPWEQPIDPTTVHPLQTIKKLGGIHGAQLVADPHGNLYVRKGIENMPNQEPHFMYNEVMSHQIMKHMGLNTPAVSMHEGPTGPELLGRYVEGSQDLPGHGASANFNKRQATEMMKNLIFDQLTGNADTHHQNLLTTSDNDLIGIDKSQTGRFLTGKNNGFDLTNPEVDPHTGELNLMPGHGLPNGYNGIMGSEYGPFLTALKQGHVHLNMPEIANTLDRAESSGDVVSRTLPWLSAYYHSVDSGEHHPRPDWEKHFTAQRASLRPKIVKLLKSVGQDTSSLEK